MNSHGARSLGNRHKIWNLEAWVRVVAPRFMDVRLQASLNFHLGLLEELSAVMHVKRFVN